MRTGDRRAGAAAGRPMTTGVRAAEPRAVTGAPGPVPPRQLVRHAAAALAAVLAAEGDAAADDAVSACYLDLWVCDRLLLRAGEHAPAARHLVPVLLLDGVGGLAAVLGERLHRADAAATEYRRRRRLLVRAARERSPRIWEQLALRPAAIAAGEDRLARPLTPVRHRALPRPLAELVERLEAERRGLAARCARWGDDGTPDAEPDGTVLAVLAEQLAVLTAAAACLDGWHGSGPTAPGIAVQRARLCGALYRLASRLELPLSDRAGTAWRADVLRCAVA